MNHLAFILDIDECFEWLYDCHEMAFCNNTNGSFNCTCYPGYGGDGVNCTDIDECKDIPVRCHGFATCTNINGSYECACWEGFTGDGVNCTGLHL